MAQRAGFVNPVAMIQSVAQVSKYEATRLVETGTLLAEVEASRVLLDGAGSSAAPGAAANGVLAPEWQKRLADELVEGRMSIDKIDAIRRVMSEIAAVTTTAVYTAVDTAIGGMAVGGTAITSSVTELIVGASGQSPEQLFRAAKRARDLLDADGIARREKQQHDLRSVRTWWDSSGMHCGSWRLATEDGALVAEAFEQILSPRRGGPRFVNFAQEDRGGSDRRRALG